MTALEAVRLVGKVAFLREQRRNQWCDALPLPTSMAKLELIMYNQSYLDRTVHAFLPNPRAMTRLETLRMDRVTLVPDAVRQLPALKRLLCTTYEDDAMMPLAGMTTLDELVLWPHMSAHLPYLPGITRLEYMNQVPHDMPANMDINVPFNMAAIATCMPNLKHLRLLNTTPTHDMAPLAALTSLTLLQCRNVHQRSPSDLYLPRNLHVVRSLRHLCLPNGFMSGSSVALRHALQATSIQTACTCTKWHLCIRLPSFRVIECPVTKSVFEQDW